MPIVEIKRDGKRITYRVRSDGSNTPVTQPPRPAGPPVRTQRERAEKQARTPATKRGPCQFLGEPIVDANGQPELVKCACKAGAKFAAFGCLSEQNVRAKRDGSTVRKGAIPDVMHDVKNRIDVGPFFTACQFCELWTAEL
jgi:hypothetical protein